VFVSLLAAGCGGGSKANHAESSVTSETLAFSHCMRSRGVANFPDPTRGGGLPKSQIAHLAASDPEFPAAHGACEHLLPNGGRPTQAQVEQAWNDMRSFAHCMRSKGVLDWPDPTPTSESDSRPFFNTPASIDPASPQITTKIRACQPLLHASNPLVTTQ
jgi:hypothetical protein